MFVLFLLFFAAHVAKYCLNQTGTPFEGTAVVHILLQQFRTLHSFAQSYIHPMKAVSELQELSEQSKNHSWYSCSLNHSILISRPCQIICVHHQFASQFFLLEKMNGHLEKVTCLIILKM